MRFHIFGGGTVSHVRPHLGLCAPAFGGTARRIAKLVRNHLGPEDQIGLHLTKMASQDSTMMTNADVEAAVDTLLADPNPAVIFFSVAMCDFEGRVLPHNRWSGDLRTLPQGLDAPRLSSRESPYPVMAMVPSEKVIGKIRKERKDIFLVGFKTTTNEYEAGMFRAGLNLLKTASCNLVLVNDLHTKRNMIVTPEVAPYEGSNPFDRQAILEELVDMAVHRAGLSFTKTNVLTPEEHPGLSAQIKLQPWREAPATLQKVVDFCVEKGAYKPFNGVTVGHFGWRESEPMMEVEGWGSYRQTEPPMQLAFWSSRRKKDFNKGADRDLVKVQVSATGTVRAWGAKPSAGARSQAQVFKDHPDYDCIVHFHCWGRDPMLPPNEGIDPIPRRPQRNVECGSHQCGQNTSNGMKEFDLGDGVKVKAVMLEKHGPNILFKSADDPEKVIAFINRNFDFDANTSKYL